MRRVLVRTVVLVSVVAVLLGAVRLPAIMAPTRPGVGVAAQGHAPSLLDRLKHAFGIGVPKQRPSLVDDGRRALPNHQATSTAATAAPRPPAKRVRELAARRQADARYFQLSDGRIQAELSATPINYRDSSGHWQPIDTSVAATTARPGFQIGNQTNRFATFFGANPASLLRVEANGAQLTVGLVGANPGVGPTVRGDTVTYRQIRPGVDLVYQVTASALKERLVLTAPSADPNVTFTLHASGATPRAQPDGAIALTAPDGRLLFALPRLFMVDAKDDPASPYGKQWSAGVTQTLSQRGADTRVTVKADAAWLASPARVYPVIVDPTIKVQQLPGEATDAMVVSDSATTNYGIDWHLGVGTTRTSIERSLVQFSLKTIPTGTQIDAADLRLFYDQIEYSDANAVTIEAHRVTVPWDESTVTWNTVSSAVGEAANSSVTKPANAGGGHWHDFSVKAIVQSWLNGTNPNDGFVLKAASEALKQGAVDYEASESGFSERNNAPMLVVTYGIPGLTLNPTTTVHATGAELSWPAYVNTTGNSANDAVEYQVHRWTGQGFKPGAASLVAPLPTTQTSFIDTTATPTAADNPQVADQDYYYLLAVKTKSGQLIAGPTQRVTVPKAGMTLKLYQNAIDTTLTSAAPTTNQNVLDGHAVLEASNDNTAHGVARALVKFPSITGIPAGASLVDVQFLLWEQEKHGVGASYEIHALNQDFDQATATWNKATATTSWTAPGGDFSSTVLATLAASDQPGFHNGHVESTVQGWLSNPSSNHGLLVKLANETTPLAHATYQNSEGEEPLFRPRLQVVYSEKTTEDTYYAPTTPPLMSAGDTVTVPVTVTNTTASTWKATDYKLAYHWTLPDGTDQTDASNQVQTALPADVPPGGMVTVQAPLKAPTPTDPGGDRTAYTAGWDLLNTTTGQYLSASAAIPALAQPVGVQQPTSDQLGLERFYQYAGKNTGAGSTAMVNQHAGNLVWSYNPVANPSRGPATFVRLTYNSLDTSNAAMGFGWSLSAASVMRMGTPLDLHPPGQDWPTTITLTDGDGTTHTFTLNKHGSTDTTVWDYDHPLGVHLYLQKMPAASIATDPSRTWVMTRPDRTQFFFDADGYQTATRDKNGNELLFTYAQRKSNNKPIKFLQYLTDATGRQTLTLTYYVKGQSYSYYDSTTNQKLAASNLTNPFIIDQLASITDVSGRQLTFTYSDKGLLKEIVDGAGNAAAKTFLFDYDMTQGNKNVKLVKVTDPRGHATNLAYNNPPVDDPQFHWWAKTITDRLGNATGFAYLDPDGPQGGQVQTTLTDARSNTTVFLTDAFGRPTSITNAKGEQTQLAWDADHNVSQITEANGAVSKFSYDPNTGYPLTITDAQAVHDSTAATVLTYNTTLSGHVADLATKTSQEGRAWAFGYDAFGNLTSVTDPKGTATPTAGDFTTTYAYDTLGQLTTATDANNHATGYSNYDVVGYPKTITDPLGKATSFVYDARGNVTQITDANQKVSTFNYDVFGRPLDSKAPKDQANNVFITTPAPVYDADDNVTQATAPNGAVTTAVYDNDDQTTQVSLPKDNASDPARTWTYAYDAVGNLTKQTEPNGTLTTSNPSDFATSYGYDALNRVTSVTDAAGDKLTYGYDNAGNTVLVVDPRKNATADPNDYTTKYTFDLAHRPKVATDALGFTTSYAYDKDGQVTSVTDKEGHTTVVKRDERAMVSEVDVPHATGVTRVTQYQYDPAGNLTKTVTPRGTETTADSTDFVLETVYDELNRVKAKKLPFSAADPNVKTADEIDYTYDAVGNLAKVSAAPSAGQTVRNDTAYSYFDNGWIKSSADPQDIQTTYDYNPLGEQTARTITSAGGSSSRTQGWSYFGDGTLSARSDAGIPVGKQVVLVDNSDSQNVTTTGTWPTSSASTGYQGYNYATHAAGTGANSFTWGLHIPQDGTYQVFVKYTGATATNAAYTITHATGTAAKTVNQTTTPGSWVSLGSYPFSAASTTQQVKLTDNANGTVTADAVKLVRDNSADTDTESKNFAYTYDPNGNLTQIADSSPGAKIDTDAITYDALDRVAKVEEKLAGAVKHTTSFTAYDENSNLTSLTHDQSSASSTYDPRDLPSSVTNTEAAGATPQVEQFTYTPNAWRLTQTKGNTNTVSSSYFFDGLLQHEVEKKPDATIVNEHTYTYDANGNQLTDVSKKQNADNTSAYLAWTYASTYDPRDRITQRTKTDTTTGATLGTESYAYDANANITSQTVAGATTSYTYDRNRLLSSVTGGATASYNYDPFGRLDTITAAGQVQEHDTYDGFDRLISTAKLNGTTTTTTNVTYDALDRRSSETTNAGTTGAKTTNLTYLGLSTQLLSEDVAGTLTKSYQYSPWGARLSEINHTTGSTPTTAYYGYNAHTDVDETTDQSGNTTATYGYTAYGQNDTQAFTGVDKPDPQNPTKDLFNPYRFNADRCDPGTQKYDMGFRTYDPGRNRFLTRDLYNGALSDLHLGTDPWTMSRYAFAGGNPLSLIELDGHTVTPDNPVTANPTLNAQLNGAWSVQHPDFNGIESSIQSTVGHINAAVAAGAAASISDVNGLTTLLNELRPAAQQGRRALGVGVYSDAEGNLTIRVAVASTQSPGRLPPALRDALADLNGMDDVRVSFVPVAPKGHAEESLIRATGENETLEAVGTNIRICAYKGCFQNLTQVGLEGALEHPAGPMRNSVSGE